MLKAGRNEPGPCGSGKKYKYCCLVGSVDRKPIDIKRESAGWMDLGGDDPILRLISVKEALYAIRKNSVVEIMLPDAIDPERKNPNAKGNTRVILDMGMDNPLVSRTIGQALELIQGKAIAEEKNLLELCFILLENLGHSYNILLDLISVSNAKAEEYQKKVEESKNKNFIKGVPFIIRLEQETKDFFINIHKCLNCILDMLNLTLPKENRGVDFIKLSKYHEEKTGVDNNISRMINHHFKTLDFLWNIRNCIEHPKNPKHKFIVHNISSNENNQLVPPLWEFSFVSWDKSVVIPEGKFILLEDMRQYLENLGLIIEDTLAAIACHELDKNEVIAYQLNINEDENAPFRYSFQLGFSQKMEGIL